MRLKQGVLLVLLSCTACAESFPLTLERRIQTLDSVAEAPTHDPDCDALRFSAIARTDLAGFVTWSASSGHRPITSSHTAALIPMVPPDWTPQMPVPLWIRTDTRTSDPKGPKVQAKLRAVAQAASAGPMTVVATQHLEADVDMDGTNAFQIGARRAMLEHSLTSPVGAPLASWPASRGTLRWKD